MSFVCVRHGIARNSTIPKFQVSNPTNGPDRHGFGKCWWIKYRGPPGQWVHLGEQRNVPAGGAGTRVTQGRRTRKVGLTRLQDALPSLVRLLTICTPDKQARANGGWPGLTVRNYRISFSCSIAFFSERQKNRGMLRRETLDLWLPNEIGDNAPDGAYGTVQTRTNFVGFGFGAVPLKNPPFRRSRRPGLRNQDLTPYGGRLVCSHALVHYGYRPTG